MNKSNTPVLLKWIMIGCFTMPLAGIFLPYYSSGGYSMSGFGMIKAAFGSKFSGFLNGIDYLCASLLFCLVAAVLLMIKDNVVIYSFASFAGVSTALKCIPVFVSSIESKAPGIGLIINTLCYVGGAVISVILLIPKIKEVFQANQVYGGSYGGMGTVPQQQSVQVPPQQTVQVPPPQQPAGMVPPQQTVAFCPNCRSQLRPGAKFCLTCGTKCV